LIDPSRDPILENLPDGSGDDSASIIPATPATIEDRGRCRRDLTRNWHASSRSRGMTWINAMR
jgi:hypothetical protein